MFFTGVCHSVHKSITSYEGDFHVSTRSMDILKSITRALHEITETICRLQKHIPIALLVMKIEGQASACQ